MRSATTVTATGDLIQGDAKERADFIRAVTAGLNDLEAGCEIASDDAAIRVGLDRNGVPSPPVVRAGHSSPARE
jgi:hypothetical protein